MTRCWNRSPWFIFDEFHERSLNSDVALAMVRRVRETVRPELKLVVMSATLGAAPIAGYLGGCPTLEAKVDCIRSRFPTLRRAEKGHSPFAGTARRVLRTKGECPLFPRRQSPTAWPRRNTPMLERTEGDVLVFLPGVGEIRQTARRLEAAGRSDGPGRDAALR